MAYCHVNVLNPAQILLEPFNHAGYCFFASSNLFHCIYNAFFINGQDRLNVQQVADDGSRFADPSSFLQILQSIHKKIEFALLTHFFNG